MQLSFSEKREKWVYPIGNGLKSYIIILYRENMAKKFLPGHLIHGERGMTGSVNTWVYMSHNIVHVKRG